MLQMRKVSLLFICMGNICRSPALAAIFLDLAKKKKVKSYFYVDSAALTTFYLGQNADYRICQAAQKKDVAISHVSRLFEKRDFSKFDYILAVNHEVKDLLAALARTPEERQKILLATAFAKNFLHQEIPDPYFHGPEAFDHVIAMAFDAATGLLEHLMLEHKIPH